MLIASWPQHITAGSQRSNKLMAWTKKKRNRKPFRI